MQFDLMRHGYIISNQKALHFVTFTIVGWVSLFSSQKYCDEIISSLRYYIKHQGLKVHAYVIMTNHVHAILSASIPKNDLSSIIGRFKSFTSKRLLDLIMNDCDHRRVWMLPVFSGEGAKHVRNKYYQIWIQNNHPIELSNPKILKQRLEYLHQNPVNKGIVEHDWHYLYSSARQYAGLPGKIELNMLDVEFGFDYLP